MTSMKTVALALCLAATPIVSRAATLQLTYTTLADSLFPASTVSVLLGTDDGTFYGAPGYLVTGISGTRDGVAITGLADSFSEIFFPDDGFGSIVDSFGLTFTAGGRDYQFYRGNPVFYSEFSYPSGDPGGIGEGRVVLLGDVSLTAVPEPASWALMMAGFAAVGLANRRRVITA